MAKLTVAFKTDTGSIPGKSEDSFLVEDNLFIIAEGVGGEYLDEIAKEMACRVIRNAFFSHLKEMYSPSDALLFAMKEANREILREGKKIGQKMAASVGVVYVRDTIVYFAHLGDARIYCLQKGEIVQLTRDHTVAKEDSPALSKARDARHKFALTEALGLRVSPPVEVKKFALHEKDLILMTTEGLTGRLSDMQIQKTSLKSTNVKKLCSQLIYEARRIDRDRSMTVGLIRLDRKVPLRKNLILSYSGLIFVCVALIAFYSRENGWKSPADGRVAVTQTASEEKTEKQETFLSPERKEAVQPARREPVPPPPEPAPLPEITKESAKPTRENEIQAFVAAWEKAWEKTAGQRGEMETYMAFYSESFSSGGFNKAAWKRDKTIKNRKKRWIRLEMRDVRIEGSSAGPRVEVCFRQIYKSSNFSINSRKKLVICREGSGWKILREKTY